MRLSVRLRKSELRILCVSLTACRGIGDMVGFKSLIELVGCIEYQRVVIFLDLDTSLGNRILLIYIFVLRLFESAFTAVNLRRVS